MEERDRAWAFQAEDIREKIAAGMASLRAGAGVDGDAFLDAMDAELAVAPRRDRCRPAKPNPRP